MCVCVLETDSCRALVGKCLFGSSPSTLKSLIILSEQFSASLSDKTVFFLLADVGVKLSDNRKPVLCHVRLIFTECLDKRVKFVQVAASAVLFWAVCLSLLIQYFNFWGGIVNEQKGLIQTVISGSE